MDTTTVIVTVAIVLGSLTVHEWAHAWSADRLGDPTARMLGRVSFNPIVHIDPIGTVILPLFAALTTGFVFGWAKPVPVNVSQLPHPKRDFMLVAAAGPASNLVIAAVAAVVFRTIGGLEVAGGALLPSVLIMVVSINVLLAVFNMLPIPPLDGGNVLAGLLPDRYAPVIGFLRQYGFLLLLALILTGSLSTIVEPVAEGLLKVLLS